MATPPSKITDVKYVPAALYYLTECCKWLGAADNIVATPEAVELDFEQIDRALLDIHTRLQDLKKMKHNRHTPVNRLPFEVLGIIFKYLTEMCSWTDDTMPCAREYPWKAIHSVCRYWRNTALHTPVLWTYFSIPANITMTREAVNNLVSIHLARSRMLPLTISCHCASMMDFFYRLPANQDFGNIARYKKLHVHSGRAGEIVLPLFKDQFYEFSTLETLVIEPFINQEWGGEHRTSTFIDGVLMPRLRTLNVKGWTAWHRASFGHLRSLILCNQVFDTKVIQDFHKILSLNPKLEELVLHDIRVLAFQREALPPTLSALSPVKLPKLMRISVHCNEGKHRFEYAILELIEKKLILPEGHAKDYIVGPLEDMDVFPEPQSRLLPFPVQKLFIGDAGRVVGTDGKTSFTVSIKKVGSFLRRKAISPASQQRVQELWLCIDEAQAKKNGSSTVGSKIIDALRAMDSSQLKKIVLYGSIPFWIERIYREGLFRSVKELQVHALDQNAVNAIRYFAAGRAHMGWPVTTLRCVQHYSDSNTLSCWRLNSIGLSFLFPEVVHEGYGEAPPQMELPEICNTRSTVQPFWHPWNSLMM